ncbi:CRISPR-associated endonuclease Cas2 [Staphylococcus massiliensis]|uniref:CRISPR-associated endoribonuclease Cas2 n=1 Tax=Staphylococcus massiliensis S46 TaxID=1229783 RepID=K9B8L4_9STAP|nr:CRISPR-associated endonuclease Cas2 [Staphylococcus massiliensis]EKU50115.1 CRISPR-associated Cas2 family protein [Staphylococcus massiliensis S46]MCG3400463.1 CRISPR-associated endonuclease Cas2 [Staphylococcus massiliensis]MCG3402181.1 CRISPR-associated endonuclease Cas2 [Staphylococcus massiliensis]MCG3412852.1 CRISPR-associated endonuclease Cas2 [Staphylococcus massiliensis]PNZ97471.1 CRISPR-associated endonuclease Cas2 [Staphylococcus massiliensis CCUG 55927]
MRVLIMFDLPVETKYDVRIYNKFRKHLIQEGFLMMQYSIYIKSCINKDAANSSINSVKRMLPPNGHVRALMITEKQYEKMQILLGHEDENIKILNDNRTLLF